MHLPEWASEVNLGFSMAADGPMSFRGGGIEEIVTNRTRFLLSRGTRLDDVVAGELVHGAEVAIVGDADRGRGASRPDWLKGIDGLVTAEAGLVLLTTHADCTPVVMYDPLRRVLGQAHAGWRGLRSGIIENLSAVIGSVGGGSPKSFKVWIGPVVRPCCYPVGRDVAAQFPEECIRQAGDVLHLDLPRFVRFELSRLSFTTTNISDSGVCTSCDLRFSSFRRDGAPVRAMALITSLG